MRIPSTLLVLLAFAAGTAVADTVMSYSTSDGPSPRIAIKGDRLRMEGGPRGQGTSIFDAAARELIVLDSSQRSYYRMDAETMKKQGRQVSEQMRRMQEEMEKQLENMPEEQRAMMREQLKQMMPEQPAEDSGDIRVQRTGKHNTVAGIDCAIATVERDGKLVQRVCMAGTGSLGMAAGDRATLQAMFAFLQEMASSFGAGNAVARIPAKMMETFDGVPIKSEDLEAGRTWTLTEIRTGNVDASQFEIPSGYNEVKPFAMDQ